MEGFRLSYETRMYFNFYHWYDYVKFCTFIFVVCGGEFSAPTGYIASPMYPKQYDHSRTCDYLIAAPIGKAITLDFTDMDMEDNSYPFCNFDYLSVQFPFVLALLTLCWLMQYIYQPIQIHSGINGNGTVLGRFCGETVPPRVVSSHNYMYMQFQSDSSISGRGFKANYSFTDIGMYIGRYVFVIENLFNFCILVSMQAVVPSTELQDTRYPRRCPALATNTMPNAHGWLWRHPGMLFNSHSRLSIWRIQTVAILTRSAFTMAMWMRPWARIQPNRLAIFVAPPFRLSYYQREMFWVSYSKRMIQQVVTDLRPHTTLLMENTVRGIIYSK